MMLMKDCISRSMMAGSLLCVCLGLPSIARADQWTAPTQEELSMTSQPEVPGAAAVYLYREEITDDNLHMWSVYVRLKVLTEEGRKYANVELGSIAHQGGGGFSIGDISGRTIHSDGTIIPFTGKPYQKVVEKTHDDKYMETVFTLPDVEVGSIIEYRFARRTDDDYFLSPRWYIQSNLFTRKAHYLWKPTNKQLVTSGERGQMTNSIAWFRSLPDGAELQQIHLPTSSIEGARMLFELNVKDIPPSPDEEYMPPMQGFSYRVLFFYSPYRSGDEFWKNEGKYWSKKQQKFIGPNSKVTVEVHTLIAPNDTQDQKLRKIYAAVMQLENTNYTRAHSSAEEKSDGLGEIHSTDDILERKRGSADQLTELFVAMARAAGMKAYLMYVTNRDRNIFTQAYMSMDQLDDYIAIVNVDGKEMYFDPGSRYCPYGHLEWKHTGAGGLREVEGGTALGETPTESYKGADIQRVANLKMDRTGVVTGRVTMTYMGPWALEWRHRALAGDSESMNRELRTSVEHLLPGGMEVKVLSVEKLEEYEQPLVVNLEVKGAIGSSTGKRLLIPVDLFEVNTKATFPHEKRDVPIYFHYAYLTQDAIRINLPEGLKVESLPAGDKFNFQNFAAYKLTTESTAANFTTRRDFVLGQILYFAKEYPDLRSFYNKVQTKDQESIVLTAADSGSKPVSGN